MELDLRLTGIAPSNADTVTAAAAWPDNPISVVNSDAVAYPFPPQPTVVFMFNPFGADTLRAVVGNLERVTAVGAPPAAGRRREPGASAVGWQPGICGRR